MKALEVQLTKQGNVLSWRAADHAGAVLLDDFDIDQCEPSFSSGRLEIRVHGRLVIAAHIGPYDKQPDLYWWAGETTLAREAPTTPPRLGERMLLLILTKEERVNIPGDLEEEYRSIAAKHGARYAKLWYYKQVVASAWPMIRKAVGWGLLASIGAWIRRYI